MAKIIQKALLLGVLGFALLGGPQAQESLV